MILALLGFGLGPASVSFGLGAGAPSAPAIAGGGFFASQPKSLPFWLRDQQGIAFEQSFGLTKDTGQDLLKQAVAARWPNPTRPDAIPLQARDRRMLRAPVESDVAFCQRLVHAHDAWLWAGTPTCINGQYGIFAPYGYNTSTCVVVPNYQVILEGGLGWFSRFIILLGTGPWALDTPWDEPIDTWLDPTTETWDTNGTTGDWDYIRASVRMMKSPGSYPVLVGIQLAGAAGDGFWDGPPGNVVYDDGGTWTDAETDAFFLPLGGVWGDEAWIGGSPLWDEPGAVWDDTAFFPPTTGWGLATQN